MTSVASMRVEGWRARFAAAAALCAALAGACASREPAAPVGTAAPAPSRAPAATSREDSAAAQDRAKAMFAELQALDRQGQVAKGLARAQQLVALAERGWGERSESAAIALHWLGAAASANGDGEAAVAAYAKGVATWEALQGVGGVDVARALRSLGEARARADPAGARVDLERAAGARKRNRSVLGAARELILPDWRATLRSRV